MQSLPMATPKTTRFGIPANPNRDRPRIPFTHCFKNRGRRFTARIGDLQVAKEILSIFSLAHSLQFASPMRWFISGVGVLLLVLSANVAEAQEQGGGPFQKDFALGVYGLGWTGPYEGAGVGFRARWEPFERLGVDVYSEHLLVQDPEGLRHDHPVGFNLYVPFSLTEYLRLRPLFGFCAVFSMVHPDAQTDRLDDVHFGIHAGAGLELALGRHFSTFLDIQATGYLGHGREIGGWSAHVGDQLDAWLVWSGAIGIQAHI